MFRLILIRFWWIFVPLFVYLLFTIMGRSKARKAGETIKPLISAALFWVIISTILLAMIGFIALGMSNKNGGGDYSPPIYNDRG